MARLNYLKDAEFLKQLDNQRIKTFFVKVIILDKNEKPIRAIEGRTTGGSIQIAGNSNVRRTGSLTFIADAAKNDLTNIENIFYLNKRVQMI